VTDQIHGAINLIENGQWYSPVAILLSATVAGLVALYTLSAHRDLARKRATLDVILKSESDEYFERIYRVFASEKRRNSGLEALINAETDSEKKAKVEVDNFLNHYELIAISINQKILDEQFYKQWMCSTYISHFKASKNYILEIRKSSPYAYIEFQRLAEKWDKKLAKHL